MSEATAMVMVMAVGDSLRRVSCRSSSVESDGRAIPHAGVRKLGQRRTKQFASLCLHEFALFDHRCHKHEPMMEIRDTSEGFA